jgi:hypothetical protein
MGKQTFHRVKKTLTLLLLASLVVSLTAASVSALCDIEGSWSFKQSNGPTVTMKNIQMTSKTGFSGRAQYSGIQGIVKGRLSENQISFTVEWFDGKIGTYRGTIYDDCSMTGVTNDREGNSANWFTS